MNIQRYYRLKGQAFLNESLIVLFFAIFLLPSFLIIGKMFFLLPYILMSVYFYQMYLLNEMRSEQTFYSSISSQVENFSFLFERKELLITFLPAPSLRMCFFVPEGCFSGEIRDLYFHKIRWFLPNFLDRKFAGKYGLFDEKNDLYFTFRLNGRNGMIVETKNGLPYIQLKKRMKKNEWIILNDHTEQKIFVKLEWFVTDFKFFDEKGEWLARVRKGWMPLEWEPFINDPNTPVFSFKEGLTSQERLAIFAILIYLYQYHNH